MKFSNILLFVAILALSQIHAQKVNTSDYTLTERKSWADKGKTAFTKTQLTEQLEGCYDSFISDKSQAPYNTLSEGDKTTILDIVGKYQYCTQGTDGATNQAQSTLVDVEKQQLGKCSYLWESVDGADQNEFYFAALDCYQTPYTTGEASQGFDVTDINSDCYNYYTNTFTGDSKTVLDNLYTCIEEAVFYTRPYTERQFYLCDNTCKENNSGIFTNDAITDAAFVTCVNTSEECARFQILNSQDATDPDYATNYKACYHDKCHKAAGIGSTVTTYFTCVEACDMPDYSYAKDESANVLTSSLLVLVLIFSTVIMF